ncbi:MAG: DMT family transporter [Acidiferrobacter sp.]
MAAENQGYRRPGILATLAAALLFGAGTPLAKILLAHVSPWLLAGLLYIGAGVGLTGFRLLKRRPPLALLPGEIAWLAGTILAGGVIAPVLLMVGLTAMSSAGASLLLNAEGVLTTLLAWFVFRENLDQRVVLGMAAIVAGVMVLHAPQGLHIGALWPTLAILGACLAWAIDNNLSRKLALADTTGIAAVKGLVAGTINLSLALSLNASLPPWSDVLGTLTVGFLSYGVSLALFMVGLRDLGAARTTAYFSAAPFFGAALATGLGAPVTARLILAALLMAAGVWLHMTEHHQHAHTHEPLSHAHEHVHDEHHQHPHEEFVAPGFRHTHHHTHGLLTHCHAHFPDAHHRHRH